ncbi:hypothetical protein K6H11_005745 [Candida tropicalis]
MGFFSSWIVYSILSYWFPVPIGVENVGPFEKGWFEENQDVESFEEELVGHEVHHGVETYGVFEEDQSSGFKKSV